MKTNFKKPSKFLTFTGILLIIIGVLIASFYEPKVINTNQNETSTSSNQSPPADLTDTSDLIDTKLDEPLLPPVEQTDPIVSSDTSYILVEKEDGSISVLPRTEANKKVIAGSTLMQYEHDYCLQYFLIDQVKMTKSDSKVVVKLLFKNTSDKQYSSAYIYCDFINSAGVIIDQTLTGIDNVRPGQTYTVELSNYISTGEETPTDFKLTRVNFYYTSGGGIGIPFD